MKVRFYVKGHFLDNTMMGKIRQGEFWDSLGLSNPDTLLSVVRGSAHCEWEVEDEEEGDEIGFILDDNNVLSTKHQESELLSCCGIAKSLGACRCVGGWL